MKIRGLEIFFFRIEAAKWANLTWTWAMRMAGMGSMRPSINNVWTGLQFKPKPITMGKPEPITNTAHLFKRTLPSINMPGLGFFSSPISIMGKPKKTPSQPTF